MGHYNRIGFPDFRLQTLLDSFRKDYYGRINKPEVDV